MTIELADATGAPVAAVESLAVRAVSADQLAAAGGRAHEALFRPAWTVVPSGDGTRRGPWTVLGDEALLALPGAERFADVAALGDAVADGRAAPAVAVLPLTGGVGADADADADAVRDAVHGALSVVRSWLADERLAESRLAVVTRRAVAAAPDEDVHDLPNAAVWACCARRRPSTPTGWSWSTWTSTWTWAVRPQPKRSAPRCPRTNRRWPSAPAPRACRGSNARWSRTATPARGTRTARCSSPVAPEHWAPSSPATSSSGTAYGACSSSAAGGSRPTAPPPCGTT